MTDALVELLLKGAFLYTIVDSIVAIADATWQDYKEEKYGTPIKYSKRITVRGPYTLAIYGMQHIRDFLVPKSENSLMTNNHSLIQI